MKPKTLSASSLKVAALCLPRWEAEYLNGARQPGGAAADLGTTCHSALEMYVKTAIMEKSHPATVKHLLDCYTTSYLEVMQSFDFDSEAFKDGERMMRVWHDRNDFDGFTVLSTEVKESFELPYIDEAGVKQFIKFNFICDRVDKLEDDVYRVVDYKSWRGLKDPSEVGADLQCRIYALAMQIKHPSAKRIWVVLDQLRGDEAGVVFTREDNAVTWRALKKFLQRIVDTPPGTARETLNDECRWCVRKSKCGALQKHTNAGGTLDIGLDDLIRMRREAWLRAGANKDLVEAYDDKIKAEFEELDLRTLETLDGAYVATVTGGKSRYEVAGSDVVRVVGPELALEIANFRKSDVERLRGDSRLTPLQWQQLEKAIKKFPGKRGLIVKAKKKEDEL